MEVSNNFEHRGLLGLPVTLPSIPLLNPLITPLLGGSTPTPTPAINIPNVTPPPQLVPTQPALAPSPDPNDRGVPANGGGGGHSTSTATNSGNDNTNSPNQNPNPAPNSSTRTSNVSNPTPNPGSSKPHPSNLSNPSSTSGTPPSQSSGTSKNGSLQLPGSIQQDSDSDGSEEVVITTISGVRTAGTLQPHPTNGHAGNDPTGGGGNGPIDGGGSGADSSGGRGLSHGIIAAIVISVILALTLLVFFLRKRARRGRAVHHTRWMPGGENGRRATFRSSFGYLRESAFGSTFADYNDDLSSKRSSGPFSDSMAVPPPTPDSAPSPNLQMTQVTHTEITSLATAVLSTGRRNSRISQFSIGSSESDMSCDGGMQQWVELRPDMGCNDNSRMSPTDPWFLPSSFSVRPFTPSEPWFFPKPPTSRPESTAYSGEIKGIVDLDPFTDPVPQPPKLPTGLLEMVTKNFEPRSMDELAVDIGDEVVVLRLFDDGWGKVKVLKNGSTRSVPGSEGFIPVDCLKPKRSRDFLCVGVNAKVGYTRQVDI